jgi:hypothetical protein
MSDGPILRQVRYDTYGSLGVGTVALVVALVLGSLSFRLQKSVDYWPFAGIALLTLLAAVFLGNGIRLKLRPTDHWLLRRLAEHGPILKVAEKIDAEWSDPKSRILGSIPAWPAWKIDGSYSFAVITQNWLVRLKPGVFQTVLLPRVVWMYKQVKANAATITVKPYLYGIGLRHDDGRTTVVELDRESDAELVLELLLRRRPELSAGYVGEWVGAGANTGKLMRAREVQRAAVSQQSATVRETWIADRLDDVIRYPRRVDPLNPETGR